MKAKRIRTSVLAVILALVCICTFAFVGCGASVNGKGTATVDKNVTVTKGLGLIFSMMGGATTELSLEIVDGNYTFTKVLKGEMTGQDGTSVDFTVCELTFTGTATKEGDVFTLAPATGVTAVWSLTEDMRGILAGIFGGDDPDNILPKAGTYTEANNPKQLNYFYTPYVQYNEEGEEGNKQGVNNKSMDVTIKDGTLDFGADFPLTEEDE